MSDPAKYRSREEVTKIRQEQDPIDRVRQCLLEEEHFDDEALKMIDREVKGEINTAAEFAQQDQEPEGTELFENIVV